MTEKTKPKPKTKSKPKNNPKRENKTDAEDATERTIKSEGAVKSGGGRLSWVVLALLIVGVAILMYASGFKLDDVAKLPQKPEDQLAGGTPTIGGPFTLVDQNGKTVTDKDFRGQYLVIYFGYTYCPDVCPTSLTNMSDALDLLGDTAARVTPMLITIDPVRDTPEHLKEYATYFHPRLHALTGSPEQIAAVTKAYRVYYSKVKGEDATEDDYLMDHSSVTYVMGPDGMFRLHFSHGTDAETMASRLRDILS